MTFYLGLLGDDDALAWSPTEATMPSIFNANAKPFWLDAVRAVFAHQPDAEPQHSWILVTLLTRKLAEDEDVQPFAERVDTRSDILRYMRTERHRLWSFCRQHYQLIQLAPRFTNVTATMNDTGFILTGDAALSPNEHIDEWARTAFRFKRTGHHYYTPLAEADGTIIALWNDHGGASTRWHMSYSVAVDVMPYTESALPTREELERAAIKLWGSVIRQRPIWPRSYML